MPREEKSSEKRQKDNEAKYDEEITQAKIEQALIRYQQHLSGQRPIREVEPRDP